MSTKRSFTLSLYEPFQTPLATDRRGGKVAVNCDHPGFALSIEHRSPPALRATLQSLQGKLYELLVVGVSVAARIPLARDCPGRARGEAPFDRCTAHYSSGFQKKVLQVVLLLVIFETLGEKWRNFKLFTQM